MTVCACYRERNMLDVSEPFPSRFQLSSSMLLLTEHSGWEKDRRAPTIISYISEWQFSLSWECILSLHTHRYTHLQSRTTQNPSCCHKMPALPKSIAGNFCYCLSLAISRFLSLFLPVYLSVLVFFCECKKLVEIAGVYVCWCRDEGWSVHRSATGKIMADNRVLMKVSGPGPTVFGVECCQGLRGSTLWVLLPCWRVETAGGSISLQKECMCKWNQFILNELTLIHRNEEKVGSGTSCHL